MAYVESPLDRIVNVHFGGGVTALTQFNVNWAMSMTPVPGQTPLWQPGLNTKHISVENLPVLSKTTLNTGVLDAVVYPEDSAEGDFPDGTTGTIHVEYYMNRDPRGFVSYITTAQGALRFGGANSISMSLNIHPVDAFRAVNIAWSARASLLGINADRSGTLPITGAALTLNATATLEPPSVSLSFE
jgi:hypothetical protein